MKVNEASLEERNSQDSWISLLSLASCDHCFYANSAFFLLHILWLIQHIKTFLINILIKTWYHKYHQSWIYCYSLKEFLKYFNVLTERNNEAMKKKEHIVVKWTRLFKNESI